MKIIMVAGKSGSGKGEVAKIIKEYYIYKLETSIITSFSKVLKNYAMELTDWDGNPQKKPRKFLQDLGDEAREIDQKFLINKMIEDMKIYERHADVVIIDDVRLPLEIDEMKLNFDDVCVIYVENQFGESTLSVDEQTHYTEIALETYADFDYTIVNDKKEELKDKVFKILEELQ